MQKQSLNARLNHHGWHISGTKKVTFLVHFWYTFGTLVVSILICNRPGMPIIHTIQYDTIHLYCIFVSSGKIACILVSFEIIQWYKKNVSFCIFLYHFVSFVAEPAKSLRTGVQIFLLKNIDFKRECFRHFLATSNCNVQKWTFWSKIFQVQM